MGVLILLLAVPTTRARADFSQDFEADTSGWFPLTTDTVTQEPNLYVSPVPYGSGVTSASPTNHARLRRPTDKRCSGGTNDGDVCTTDADCPISGVCVTCRIDTSGSIGPSVVCGGPFTRWGGYNNTWQGGYTTQVDVYLDTDYARANPDSINGNLACLTANAADTTCKGTRFDFTSAINDANGNFFQDYAFDVGTGNPSLSTPCANGGFVVIASTNLYRSGANIYDPGNDPFCIADSGWYTLKHTFTDVGGFLQVRLEIFQLGNAVPLHTWTISPGKSIAPVPGDPNQPGVGCNRYGWFADQEIWDLPIDNSIMVGCGTPATTTTTTTTISTTTTTLLDHFQCYEVKPGDTPLRTISAQDQFGTLSLTLRFPHRLCAPTDKNHEYPSGPNHPDHLVGYKTTAKFTKRTNQTIVNQLGTLQLDVVRPGLFMVPSSKDGVPMRGGLDHFTCYKVRRSHGAPKFVQRTVNIVDQFETLGSLTLLKPFLLCAPASKNNEDPTAPFHPAHLLCYKAKSTPFGQSDHTIVNQFGPDQVTIIHRRELCVPSLKNPSASTTSSTSSSTSSTSSSTSTTLMGSPSGGFIDPR